MLDELAMRLKVQGGMRWSPGTATRLGRIQSVIRSLLLHATSSSSFQVSSSVVIAMLDEVPFQSEVWGGAACHASPVSNPVLLSLPLNDDRQGSPSKFPI